MRLFRGYWLGMIVVLARATIAFVERVADSVVEFLLEPFRPDKINFTGETVAPVPRIDRPSLPAHLLNALRHEAGVPRLGAARGT